MPVPGAQSGPTITRRVAVALSVLVCLSVPPPAVAQDRGPTPSADELRNEYPLDASPQPTPDEAPSPAAAASPASRPQGAQDGGSGLAVARLAALAIVIAALAGGFALGMLLPERRGARSGRSGPRPPASNAMPPAPDRAWTAEIEWHGGEGSPRFRVVARTPDEADRTPVAESPALEWPPTSPEAVQALTLAAKRLETALIAAGWTPLPPGEPWYAKRFAWEPAPERPESPPAAAPPAAGPARVRRRFQRGHAWPRPAHIERRKAPWRQ